MSTRPSMTTQNIMSTDRVVYFMALLLTLTRGVASGEDPSLEPPTIFQAAGVAPSFFAASDALRETASGDRYLVVTKPGRAGRCRPHARTQGALRRGHRPGHSRFVQRQAAPAWQQHLS